VNENFDNALYSVLQAAAVLGMPPLLAALVVGFLIGLLQAVTQLQEQTLPQSAKLIVVAVVLAVFGVALCAPLVSVSKSLFSGFYLYGRS